MKRHPACLLLAYVVFVPPAFAQEGLLHRWQFARDHVGGQTAKPLAGSLEATVVGPVEFDAKPPHGLRLTGDSKARHHVSVAKDIAGLSLPAKAISVEAWVQVDKAIEWGGIAGVIQDNGDYERGWLLGTRKWQFCFGLASAKTKRLTYLTDPRSLEPGQWYHVVGTYDGREQRLFVDGTLRATSKAQAGEIAYPPKAPFTLAAYHDDNEFYALAGQIEGVSIYGRALTAKEVAARFEQRKSRFPGIVPVRPKVAGWPTYRRDNQRTGISGEELQFPLHPQWVHQVRYAPRPAWPPPAKQDFWHNKRQLSPRVIFDRAFHLVAMGDAVCFGSSADDRVVCLDAKSGSSRWSFTADGPVRLAPTIHRESVLFGSDDGHVYCMRLSDGKLQWKHRVAPEDRRVPGNGRVISAWPVRTGVLVEENVAYACAGLFPNQGVFNVALDVRSGRPISSGSVNVSPQGYLQRRGGRLYVATGRDPAGSFLNQLKRRGKTLGPEVRRIPEEFPYAFVGAGSVRFGGGEHQVAAFAADTGNKIWSAAVKGKAYSLAVAEGHLLVSTDAGYLYRFGPKKTEPKVIAPPATKPFPYRDTKAQQTHAATAKQILAQVGLTHGYCLVLASGDGALAYELARQSELQVVGLESDPRLVAASRQALHAAGLANRVAVHSGPDEDKLPCTDYLFNLIVDGGVADTPRWPGPRAEITRVLRPFGGVAFLDSAAKPTIRRGPLPDVGEWTHMYADAANTVCSEEQHIRGPLALQWFGGPGPRKMIDRHHRTVAPLCKHGNLIVPGDDTVMCVDAYNGTLRWSKNVPGSRRIAAYRDCSYLVLGEDLVYVAVKDRCLGLDLRTGKQQTDFRLTPATDKEPRDWGYLALAGERLLGSGVRRGASRHQVGRPVAVSTYRDFAPIVCSDFVFSMDPKRGTRHWTFRPGSSNSGSSNSGSSNSGSSNSGSSNSLSSSVVNPTITVGDGKMFFVATTSPCGPDGRGKLVELLKEPANLVALDLRTGAVLWRKPYDLSAVQHNLYAAYADGVLVLSGSYNSGADKRTAEVRYDVRVIDAATGETKWKNTQRQGAKIGGDHGEKDLRPVIVGNRLYCEPYAYELRTGKPIADWGWIKKRRSGCGNLSACPSTLFFRDRSATMFDLASKRYAKVTAITRPGCWINMIPASGLLLVPEASSGCTCNFAVQSSLAFLPRGR